MKTIQSFLTSLFVSLVVLLTTASGASAQSVTLFSDTVENGTNGWVATGSAIGIGNSAPNATTSGQMTLWHQSERQSQSPTHSWYYGKEDTGNYDTGDRNWGVLTSPSISLPENAQDVILHFAQFLHTENSAASSSGNLMYDVARVEVSSDNGNSWHHLAQFRSSDNGWETVHTSIPSYYLDSSLIIRFSFDTGDALFNDFQGWFVDDISVTATLSSPSPTPTPTPIPTPTPTPVNHAPVANPGGPYTAVEGQPVTFNASSSTDPDGDYINGYTWTFDYDNNPASYTFIPIPTINHTYTKGGTYTVRLTVQDGKLQSEPVFTTVTVAEVNDAPTAQAGNDQAGFVGQPLNFNGSLSSDEEGAVTYRWDFGDGTSAEGATPSHVYAQAGSYTTTLTVTDLGGLTATDTLSVTVVKDAVAITKAVYLAAKKQLIVEATSNGAPDAQLQVLGKGPMVYDAAQNLYRLTIQSAYTNAVTITSTYGGSATSTVSKQSK